MPSRSLFALALGLAVLLGLGVYAYVAWDKAQPVPAEQAEEIADQGQLQLESIQQDLETQLEGARSPGEAEDRLDTMLGQVLFDKCYELTELHSAGPSAETERLRDKACEEYRLFVDEGVVPEE